jgi:hypothetical protein
MSSGVGGISLVTSCSLHDRGIFGVDGVMEAIGLSRNTDEPDSR